MLQTMYGNGYFRAVKRYHFLFALFVSSLFLAHSCGQHESTDALRPSTDTLRLVAEQTARVSRLHTTELQIHKLVTHSDQSRLRGTVFSVPVDMGLKPGERKVAIPIDVTVRASIDFSKFSSHDVRRDGDKVVITLPDPQIEVTAARIDHSGVRQYIDPLRSQFSDRELTDLARRGENAILKNLDRAALADRAREDARLILLPLLRRCGVGDGDVSVIFREGLQIDSLRIIRL